MTHLQQQAARFGRLFAFAFASQAVLLNWSHLDRSAIVAAAVAALETAYRQFRPPPVQ